MHHVLFVTHFVSMLFQPVPAAINKALSCGGSTSGTGQPVDITFTSNGDPITFSTCNIASTRDSYLYYDGTTCNPAADEYPTGCTACGDHETWTQTFGTGQHMIQFYWYGGNGATEWQIDMICGTTTDTPTTNSPTTTAPTTTTPTTDSPTTNVPTTNVPTASNPTTITPTTESPTTRTPTTATPTTAIPTTAIPTTATPTTTIPTTATPTTSNPTTITPTTRTPTTAIPTTTIPTTVMPTTSIPTTAAPTTVSPTTIPTTTIPTTYVPTTVAPTTVSPSTSLPTTTAPTIRPIHDGNVVIETTDSSEEQNGGFNQGHNKRIWEEYPWLIFLIMAGVIVCVVVIIIVYAKKRRQKKHNNMENKMAVHSRSITPNKYGFMLHSSPQSIMTSPSTTVQTMTMGHRTMSDIQLTNYNTPQQAPMETDNIDGLYTTNVNSAHETPGNDVNVTQGNDKSGEGILDEGDDELYTVPRVQTPGMHVHVTKGNDQCENDIENDSDDNLYTKPAVGSETAGY